MNFILLMGHSPTNKCRKLLFLPGRFVSPVPLIVVSRISQKPWNNISVDFAEKVVQAPKKKKELAWIWYRRHYHMVIYKALHAFAHQFWAVGLFFVTKIFSWFPVSLHKGVPISISLFCCHLSSSFYKFIRRVGTVHSIFRWSVFLFIPYCFRQSLAGVALLKQIATAFIRRVHISIQSGPAKYDGIVLIRSVTVTWWI